MAELAGSAFENPTRFADFTDGTGRVELVDLNGHAVGRGTFEPAGAGRRTSSRSPAPTPARSTTIGYVLEWPAGAQMDDGTEREFGPGDTFPMPPGHDAWIVGDEACVILDFGGLKGYAQAG